MQTTATAGTDARAQHERKRAAERQRRRHEIRSPCHDGVTSPFSSASFARADAGDCVELVERMERAVLLR